MILITESKPTDLPALRTLFLQERINTFTWLNTSLFSIADFDKETAGEFVLVAKEDNKIVGFITVWEEDNFIHHLFIDEKHQNQGIGTVLIKAVIDKFGLPIKLKCLSNNTKAVEFYQRKGFEEKGKGATTNGTFILFELREGV
ncbi:GNAT family N-acetyltransferase [Arcicella lustrica]|uniref:GNAT family N-acetyltransferase n=1 Tax=Arcicella lustrica TaxID=2984196 RepID=A0ABU5SNF5_9BACT|nr:GNAT family N-acetyltransferase [Arcicella sp. DC25W]MEA5428811.1 GNAT family N-acetyltransferase [Arcicella sp. DC25W]